MHILVRSRVLLQSATSRVDVTSIRKLRSSTIQIQQEKVQLFAKKYSFFEFLDFRVMIEDG